MKLKIESDFMYKGLRCVVAFQPEGYRSGYVGVKPENHYYGKWHGDLNIECHGGLTYSGGYEGCWYPVKSDLWWFGFDCANCSDENDIELERHILDTEYVINECKKIVDKLTYRLIQSDMLATHGYIGLTLEEIDKLAEYKRNNRIYILPCAIGSKVYMISQRVNDFTGYSYPVIIQSSFRLNMIEDLNKSIFLTKEEADAALEKIRIEENV